MAIRKKKTSMDFAVVIKLPPSFLSSLMFFLIFGFFLVNNLIVSSVFKNLS